MRISRSPEPVTVWISMISGIEPQMSDHAIVRTLRDGQGGEGQHAETGSRRVEVGAVADDHLPLLQARSRVSTVPRAQSSTRARSDTVECGATRNRPINRRSSRSSAHDDQPT